MYDSFKNSRLAAKTEILKRAELIHIPDNITDTDLQVAYKTARAMDEYLVGYFNDKDIIAPTSEEYNAYIVQILNECYDELVVSLENVITDFDRRQRMPSIQFTNLFEAAGTKELFLSNKYTRVITEKLGHKFEKIASFSNKVFDSETKLNITIRGVDIIVYNNNQIRYTQLKTKKDTLTGSQVPRSNKELTIHENSLFVASLNLGSNWTFNNKSNNINEITRLTGSRFWSIIGVDYLFLLEQCKNLVTRLNNLLY